MKKTIINMFVLIVALSIGITTGCSSVSSSGETVPDPILGEPTLLQQVLNLLPAVPVAGKNLKFVLGGDIWIAKVDGRDFLAGSIIFQDMNEGSILTLNQTHVYVTIPKIGSVGWVRTPGPEMVLEYKEGPPASLKLVSLSMGRNDSSARAMAAFINTAVEEATTATIMGVASSSGEDDSIKVVTAQDAGLKDSDFNVTVNNYSTITITGYTGTARDLVIPSTLYDLTVTHINRNTFVNKRLTSVVIPDSVIVIGENAFRGNTNLKEITISDSVISIEKGAFENNNAERVILGTNLQIIRENAFRGNTNLREITIPDSVISIEKGAFENNNAERIILGTNLQMIGQNAFKANRNLTEITIPDSVTRIEDGAFADCGITGINWGNGLLVIGAGTFMNNRLTGLILPESLSHVGRSSFGNNPITTVVIPPSMAQNTRERGISTGFVDAFIFIIENSKRSTVQRTNCPITRITLPADVHQNNMKQFEPELRTFYQAMNNAAGTYVKNAPLPIPGSRPYWTKE